jgi:hypothetical protein
MGLNDNSKEVFLEHFKLCWNQYIHFKETKDKIVFFIGTLFITVLFGSGFLIFKSSQFTDGPSKILYDKLYVLQYFLMHFFFLLLYLYYTYNNVQEKTFLIESQCCQYKLREELLGSKEYFIPVPISLIKRYYSDGVFHKTFIKGRNLKDSGNVIMFVIYSLFSTIPMWFKRDFILFSEGKAVVQFNVSWILIGIIGILLLILVIFTGTQLIKSIKRKILVKWDISEKNSYGI